MELPARIAGDERRQEPLLSLVVPSLSDLVDLVSRIDRNEAKTGANAARRMAWRRGASSDPARRKESVDTS